ncbi:hypothetical protein NW759_008198 [Fusarium solani]|uniref:Uncharacterized protein n=1 Tax=Fusarium solani TaxID=169388 RepID=A0A9P9I0H7_FUSSL|nr:uncharacterized protein B0J15DRAFT_580120 [Fusarium solani]KAH7266124.1 hypothetical protein B0J15DRAFT_580120 [Fusarium solani]KAJ4219044.1 hypothetical protein NW759_008198 [Fusarium solani]
MPRSATTMDEPAEVTAEAEEDQPIAENAVPAPDVDVTQTLQWLSIDNPNLLDVTSLIIMNNLEVVATRIQSQEKMLLDIAQQVRKGNRGIDQLGGQTSRRSSVGSRRSSTGQPASEALAEEDQGARAFDEIVENLSALDDCFERFILGSDHTPLVRRSKHVLASSTAFVEATKGQPGSQLDEAIINKLSSLNDEEIIDIYIKLSKRNRTNKSAGKKVVTVTESFHTDIIDGTDSQSTQVNTPHNRSSKHVAPKTPARRTRSRAVIQDSDDDDDADDGEDVVEGSLFVDDQNQQAD